jgi:hypothetical protein
MKQGFPALSRRKEYGKQHCSHGTDHGVEKSGKGETFMGSLKLLDGFVEIDDAVEKRKYLRCKRRHITHGPVVGIDYRQDIVHPRRMNQRPCHEWQEWNLDRKRASVISKAKHNSGSY